MLYHTKFESIVSKFMWNEFNPKFLKHYFKFHYWQQGPILSMEDKIHYNIPLYIQCVQT